MDKIFCSRLRELRGEMSQTTFSAIFNTKQTTYSSWESGTKDPAASVLPVIANTFGVSTDWLLGLSDVRAKSSQPSEDVWQSRAMAAEDKVRQFKLILSQNTQAFKMALDAFYKLQEIVK